MKKLSPLIDLSNISETTLKNELKRRTDAENQKILTLIKDNKLNERYASLGFGTNPVVCAYKDDFICIVFHFNLDEDCVASEVSIDSIASDNPYLEAFDPLEMMDIIWYTNSKDKFYKTFANAITFYRKAKKEIEKAGKAFVHEVKSLAKEHRVDYDLIFDKFYFN